MRAAHAARFDDVFLIPVKKSREARTVSRPRDQTIEEVEFSDAGRSPRQGLGWVLLAALGFWAVVAALIVIAT